MSEPSTVGLDPTWVGARVLELSAGDVAPAVTFDGFVGTGQMSRNARFSIRWEAPRADDPRSVVVKIPSADPGTRAGSFQSAVYERECEFYRSVASLVDVAVPGALAVHFDAAAEDFAIILEDLDRSEQGDQFTEPTDDQLQLAVDQASALHAPVWGATSTSVFALYQNLAGERAVQVEQLVTACLPLVFERLGDGLESDVVALLERFETLAASWSRSRGGVTTLVHGDFRPDNFMFGVDPTAPPLVIVDWQTLGLGPGVTDVSYLLGGALRPERRREVERQYLAQYRSDLERRGVSYGHDECLLDYALGALHGVMIAVAATAMADHTERGDALFTLMLNRHGRHAIDFEVLDLVVRRS